MSKVVVTAWRDVHQVVHFCGDIAGEVRYSYDPLKPIIANPNPILHPKYYVSLIVLSQQWKRFVSLFHLVLRELF